MKIKSSSLLTLPKPRTSSLSLNKQKHKSYPPLCAFRDKVPLLSTPKQRLSITWLRTCHARARIAKPFDSLLHSGSGFALRELLLPSLLSSFAADHLGYYTIYHLLSSLLFSSHLISSHHYRFSSIPANPFYAVPNAKIYNIKQASPEIVLTRALSPLAQQGHLSSLQLAMLKSPWEPPPASCSCLLLSRSSHNCRRSMVLKWQQL